MNFRCEAFVLRDHSLDERISFLVRVLFLDNDVMYR